MTEEAGRVVRCTGKADVGLSRQEETEEGQDGVRLL